MWQDPKLLASYAPKEIQNWAFSGKHGVPIILEAKWTQEKDDRGRVLRYICDRTKVFNNDNDLRITWEIVRDSLAESRATGASIKDCVAKRVDMDDPNVPKSQYIRFANAPDRFAAPKSDVEVKKDFAGAEAAAKEYWDRIAASKKKPKDPTTAPVKEPKA